MTPRNSPFLLDLSLLAARRLEKNQAAERDRVSKDLSGGDGGAEHENRAGNEELQNDR